MPKAAVTFVLVLGLLLPTAGRAQWTEDAQKCADLTDPDAAWSFCTRALESGQLSEAARAVTLNNRGNANLNRRDYDRAIQDYNESLRLDPSSALAHNNRGSAYQHRGDYDQAIRDYDAAIRLDSSIALFFGNRGRAHHFKESYAEAIKDYEQAIELNPDFALAYYNRGLARFDQGLYIASVPDFVRAMTLDSSNPYRVLGVYLAKARAGDVDRQLLATGTRQLNRTRWPGPLVALYLGELTPQALIEATRDADVRSQREKQCEAYFHAGEFLLMAGQREAALRMFQSAVATGITSFYEYASARAELRRLSQ
jgi:lipoprotein NlpI